MRRLFRNTRPFCAMLRYRPPPWQIKQVVAVIKSPSQSTPPCPNGADTPVQPKLWVDPATDIIAQNLRALYGEIEQEALPDKFRALLDQLAKGGGQ